MQTHLMSKIMHQNIAIILWQFNYSKNCFLVLAPECLSLYSSSLLRLLHKLITNILCQEILTGGGGVAFRLSQPQTKEETLQREFST